MAQKYRKIDPRIWSDEKFSTLNSDEKLLALYCLSSPQGNRIGIFRFSLALTSEDLCTPANKMATRFAHVCRTMRWKYDDTCKVLYFPTWWKYNQPENGSVLCGNLEDLHDVPACRLVGEFLANTRFLAQSYRVRDGKNWQEKTTREIIDGLAHVSSTTGTRVPHVEAQEQEQEQEQEQDSLGPHSRRERFSPPSLEEVSAYCAERSNGIDPQAFVDHYAAKGWIVGKTKMRDWRAAVRTWESRRREEAVKAAADQPKPQPKPQLRIEPAKWT